MGLETGDYIDDLVATNPVHATDNLSESDDHLRFIKKVLLASFPNVDGACNSTPAEANVLAGVTPGTSAASKAVVLDGSDKIDALDITALTLNGTLVTSTPAEINTLDGFTGDKDDLNFIDVAAAGTVEASKAVVVDGSKNISGLNQVTLSSSDAGASPEPYLILDRSSASPADDDWLGQVTFRGKNSAPENIDYARIIGRIVDATDATEDGAIYFQTEVAGSVDSRAYIGSGLVVGTPTGGDKGAGTINAVGVYDDNVLLTCYVFDAALDNDIDESKWNDKVPDLVEEIVHPVTGEVIGEKRTPRDHAPMKEFKQKLHGANNPLDIDNYAHQWKTKRHLTSLPDEKDFKHGDYPAGVWIQKLVESMEIQAVLIEQLNQRLKAVET